MVGGELVDAVRLVPTRIPTLALSMERQYVPCKAQLAGCADTKFLHCRRAIWSPALRTGHLQIAERGQRHDFLRRVQIRYRHTVSGLRQGHVRAERCSRRKNAI